jgi:hypothetical protein
MADETKPGALDPHALSSTYPDASAIFSFRSKELSEVKASALVVLDTNALLVPYRTGRSSLDEIRKIYGKLVKSKRLVVPAQVAREFAHQRAEHLKNTYKQLSDRQSVSIKTDPYPLFERLPEYEGLKKAEQEATKALDAYRDAVGKLLETMRGWQWNDPVSSLYCELFSSEVIVEPAHDRKKLLEELEYRYTNRVPPGFKDEKKADGGIGDFLIWKTILEVGSKKQDVVFVSGDEKSDWWYRSDGTALYPRFELVDEFRRQSEGRSLHLIPFAKLLELFGASKDVVNEVRREQQAITARGAPGTMRFRVERAVERWLGQRYENVIAYGDPPPHFTVDDSTGLHAVYVYPIALRHLIAEKVATALNYASEHHDENPLIILGASLNSIALQGRREIAKYLEKNPGKLGAATIIVGRVGGDGTFSEVAVFSASSSATE